MNQLAETGVVVGCDGSAAAARAVDFAVQEALLRETSLLVVGAYQFPVVAFPAPVLWPADYPGQLIAATRKQAQDGLDLALERAGHPKLDCAVVACEGRPSDVLLSCAASAQLLVVGARGLGRWGRLTMGSTSTEVVHHATIPVIVVPSGPDAAGSNAAVTNAAVTNVAASSA